MPPEPTDLACCPACACDRPASEPVCPQCGRGRVPAWLGTPALALAGALAAGLALTLALAVRPAGLAEAMGGGGPGVVAEYRENPYAAAARWRGQRVTLRAVCEGFNQEGGPGHRPQDAAVGLQLQGGVRVILQAGREGDLARVKLGRPASVTGTVQGGNEQGVLLVDAYVRD
jgi:hypothetical protein